MSILNSENPSSITKESVTLSGVLESLNGESSLDVWFDYSTNESFSSYDSTPTQTLTETGSFSDDVSGLIPLETYYVRAAATDGTDMWHGEIKSFIAADFEYVEDGGDDFGTGTLDGVEVSDNTLKLENLGEDFEDDDIKINLSGDWERTTTSPHEGLYSLESSNKEDESESSAYITFGKGNLSLYYRVSSEEDYDKFYILLNDETIVDGISGSKSWELLEVVGEQDENILECKYTKDSSVSEHLDAAFIDSVFVGYKSPGTRTTPEIDISTLPVVEGSVVQWTSTEPTGTSITVESAISEDGGSTWNSWQTCTNGDAVPGLADADLTDARIKFRQTLETTDPNVRPTLERFEFYVVKGTAGTELTADILGVSYTPDVSVANVPISRRLSASIQAISVTSGISTRDKYLFANIAAVSSTSGISAAKKLKATLPAFIAEMKALPMVVADLELQPGWIEVTIEVDLPPVSLDIPLPGFSVEITQGSDADIFLPSVQVEIQMSADCKFDINLPAARAEVSLGTNFDVTLPAVTTEIVPHIGILASFDVTLPGVFCEVISKVTRIVVFDALLPGLDAEMAVVQGWQADLDISLSGLEVTFDVTHIVQPSTLSLDISLPGVESTINSTVETIAYLDATLPAVVVSEGRIQVGNVAQQIGDIYLHHKRFPEWQSWY